MNNTIAIATPEPPRQPYGWDFHITYGAWYLQQPHRTVVLDTGHKRKAWEAQIEASQKHLTAENAQLREELAAWKQKYFEAVDAAELW